MKPEKEDFRVVEYPIHLGDLLGGTGNLDDAQFGAYMRLLFANVQAQAKKGGLPANQQVLRSYTRMGPKAWEKLWLLIGDKFVQEGDLIFHPRVKEKVNEIINLSNTKRNNRMGNNNSESTAVNHPNIACRSNPKTHKPETKNQEINPESYNNNRARESGGTGESGFPFQENDGGAGLRPLGVHLPKAFNIEYLLSDKDRETARGHAPGWDLNNLIREYNAWVIDKAGAPDKPVPAFMGWLKKKTKGKRP